MKHERAVQRLTDRVKNKLNLKYIVATILSCSILLVSTGLAAKSTIGWVEQVHLVGAKILLRAKIDTGADNSSLNIESHKIIKKGGEDWISFSITNAEGQTVGLHKKIIKYVKIKRKNSHPQMRPVISLGICVANVLKTVNVNLVDRSNFKYQLLIGRSFLKNDLLVDSSVKYTTPPNCEAVVE